MRHPSAKRPVAESTLQLPPPPQTSNAAREEPSSRRHPCPYQPRPRATRISAHGGVVRLIDGDKLFARQNIIFGGRHAAAVESAFVLLCQRFEERADAVEVSEAADGWVAVGSREEKTCR
jgi:acyl-coenzyme A thioesterase PaaI-like protein